MSDVRRESKGDAPSGDAADDFYIGYAPRMPARSARVVRPLVALLLVAAIVAPLVLVAAQRAVPPGVFEFGDVRSFTGFIEVFPVPVLEVAREGRAGAAGVGDPDGVAADLQSSRYLLVGGGKHGALDRVAEWAGRRVTLEGTLISRAGTTMIELADASIRDASVEAGAPVEPDAGSAANAERPIAVAAVDLGVHRLRGEIVDSKCWLGVMKPGEWKPHRACATRCIAGGIPPLFVVDTAEGGSLQFLLVGTDGEAVNSRILDRIAEPLVIEGRVARRGAMLFLHADPSTYARVPAPH